MTQEPAGPPATPPDGLKLLDVKARMLYFLTMQGLGVAVLAVWVYMLQADLKQYRQEISACNSELQRVTQAQNDRLLETLVDLNRNLETLNLQTVKKRR